MNVEEAMAKAPNMSDNAILVAKPPLTWGSEAMFVELTDDYMLPQGVKEAGWEPLLAKEEMDDLLAFLKTKAVGSKTVAEFIIHYAVLDCPPSWIDDIPDA